MKVSNKNCQDEHDKPASGPLAWVYRATIYSGRPGAAPIAAAMAPYGHLVLNMASSVLITRNANCTVRIKQLQVWWVNSN